MIGSGPAGLAAAQQLTRAGHAVTVFERADAPGGLLRYGIPEFKMEKRHLDRRMEQMHGRGDQVPLRRRGRRPPARSSTGSTPWCWRAARRVPRDLPVPGRELAGIHQAMEYLPLANRASAADRRPTPISARGQARGDHRRRRHRRGLPRHLASGRARCR